MYHTVDATAEDQGPIRDNQIQMSLYYVCFVVVFSFFFLNMFVALIIVTFQEQGEKEMDGCELDRNQVFNLIFLPKRRNQTVTRSFLSFTSSWGITLRCTVITYCKHIAS